MSKLGGSIPSTPAKPNKKKPPKVPTGSLSIQLLKAWGYSLPKKSGVEQWKHGKGFMYKQDWYGFADRMTWHPAKPGVLAIQETSVANVRAHIRKALAIPEFISYIKCPARRFEIWGWKKYDNRYKCVRHFINPISEGPECYHTYHSDPHTVREWAKLGEHFEPLQAPNREYAPGKNPVGHPG